MDSAAAVRMMCPACNARYDGGGKFCAKDGTPLVKDAQPKVGDMVGQVLADRYRIIKLLGEGGMGQVYEAQHVNINKRFAIKLLRPEIVSNPEAVQRFRQEAWSASSIGHDNIIEIDDFATLPTGAVYLAMEYLAGQSLSERMKKAPPLNVGEALNIFAQVANGLQAAHEKAIIHRDMKPENIFLASKHNQTVVKILDFGIAKVSGAESSSLTRTGAIFGTPHYMSPEQALGKPLDHRSDVYSVGVIMYEVFTGRVPFEAESFMGILTKHITSEPKRPTEMAPDREIPPEIEHIILRAMAKEPNDRYGSMAELMSDIVSVLHMYAPNFLSPTGSQPLIPPRSAPMPAASRTGGQTPIAPTLVASGAQADAIRKSQPPPGLRGPSQPVAATMMAPDGRPPTGPQAQLRGPSQAQAVRPATPPLGVPVPSTGANEPIPYAYEEPPRKKSSLGLVLGLVGLLIAGGGAAAFVVFKKEPEAPKPIAETPKPVAAAAVVPVPQPTPPPRPSAPADERVIVDSLPPGAKIMKDEVQIGETPEDVRVPAGGTVQVTLHKDGFVDEPVTVDPSKGRKLLVKLDKAHSSGASKESRKGTKSPVYSTPANLPRLKETPAPVAATPPPKAEPPKAEPPKAEPPKKHKPAADPYERLDDTPSRKGDVLNPY